MSLGMILMCTHGDKGLVIPPSSARRRPGTLYLFSTHLILSLSKDGSSHPPRRQPGEDREPCICFPHPPHPEPVEGWILPHLCRPSAWPEEHTARQRTHGLWDGASDQ